MHVDRAPKTEPSDEGGHSGRSRALVRRRLPELFVGHQASVPDPRTQYLEGRLAANHRIGSRKAALGNHGGFFRFWRSIMELGSYCLLARERASERQRWLAVNQSCLRALRRFESCRSHIRKQVGGRRMPPTPNWMGTGLLSRAESVRARPAATTRDIAGHKLCW